MKTYKFYLVLIVALLASQFVAAERVTYPDWTSTNHEDNSSSETSFVISHTVGNALYFTYWVESEYDCDMLHCYIDGNEVLTTSDSNRQGVFDYTFTTSGESTVIFRYTKDGSESNGADEARVTNVVLADGAEYTLLSTKLFFLVSQSEDFNSANLEYKIFGGVIEDLTVSYESSNEGVVTVSPEGKLTAVAAGTAEVTVTASREGYTTTQTCSVEVQDLGSDYRYVYVETPGTLSQLISEEDKWMITDLAVGGNLNDDDLRFLREMAGRDNSNNVTAGLLNNLNMLMVKLPNNSFNVGFNGCGSLASIVMPATVTSMTESIFYNCSNLRSAILPEGLTRIPDHAFYGCSSLTSISIPASVTSIDGNEAFAGTTKLTSVEILENSRLTTIGGYAFRYSGIKSIFIPSEVTTIADYAFYNSALETITFAADSQLKTIGTQCFYENNNLKNVVLPNTITNIGQGAFYSCDNLLELTIPMDASITSIGTSAFYNCYNLKSINIPSTIVSLGANAFYGCSSLETATVGEGCKMGNLPDDLFNGCSSLKSFNLPERVTSIGNRVFSNCSSLNDFNIPSGSKLNAVGTNAFKNTCFSKFYIPQLLTDLSNIAYQNSNLQTITAHPSNVAFKAIDGVLYSKEDNTLITVPQGLRGSYRTPDFLTAIPAGAFSGCTKVSAITLSSALTTIGTGAFDNCSSIKVIYNLSTVPPTADGFGGINLNKVPVFVPIGSLATYQATNWNDFPLLAEYSSEPSIWLSDSKVTLYDTQFDETRLKDVSAFLITNEGPSDVAIQWSSDNDEVAAVEDGHISVVGPGDAIIKASAMLGEVSVENTVATHVVGFGEGQNVYYVHAGNLPSLISDDEKYEITDLTLFGTINGTDLRLIREMAGSDHGCNHTEGKLAKLDMTNVRVVNGGYSYVNSWHSRPEGSNYHSDHYTIEDAFDCYAFYDCDALREILLPANLRALGYGIFEYCDNLEAVVLPENITVIPDYAFYNCLALSQIQLSDIQNVGRSAFYNCRSLTQVDLSAVQSIGADAFVNSAEEIRIPVSQVPELTGTMIDPNTQYVVVPAASLADYRAAENWHNFWQQIVPDDAQLALDVTVTADDSGSAMYDAAEAVSPAAYVTRLTVHGSINSYDIFAMRTKMPNLHYLDLTDAQIVANPYEYYTNCHTENHRLGRLAFYEMKNLREVTLPNSITEVGASAFQYCSNLRKIKMYEGIETVGPYALSSCNSLARLDLPDGIKSINYDAFSNCSNLQEIHFGNGLLTLGSSACYGDGKLETVRFPESTEQIESNAFEYCYSLKNLTLPRNLKSVSYRTFSSCSALECVILPSSIRRIGECAFSDCNALHELRLPPMLEQISDNAFLGCNNLTDVYTYVVVPKDIAINQNTFPTNCYNMATLHVPNFSRKAYLWNTQWGQFAQMTEFDEPYEEFYAKNTLKLDDNTGGIDGEPNAEVHETGAIVVEGNVQQNLGNVDLNSNGTDGGSLIPENEGNMTIKHLNVKISVEANRWYFFCFPFNVPLDNVQYGGEYVWRQYDGAARSRHEGGWRDLPAGTTQLMAGRGYIFQGTSTSTLHLNIHNPEILCADTSTDLDTYQGADTQAADANWNFVGNPYTSYYEVTEETYSAPITVWTGNGYEAYRPGDDDYELTPYQAFFVQSGNGNDNVNFNHGNRNGKEDSDENQARNMARRMLKKVNPDRLLVNLVLTAGDEKLDKTRIVLNNNSSSEYESSCDAAKFFCPTDENGQATRRAEIYTLSADGTSYAINERPEQGDLRLGFVANQKGTYSIGAERMEAHMLLVDNVLDITHDLYVGPYEFTSAKGTFNKRFTLKRADEDVTSLDQLAEKVGLSYDINNGSIAIGGINADTRVALYTTGGQLVDQQRGDCTLHAKAGVYVLSVGSMSVKVVIK